MTAWRNISTAPRDGTFVEIECRFGYPAWRRVVKWTKDKSGYHWCDLNGGGPAFENSCVWRPWYGDQLQHYDPYDGFDSFDYYRGNRPIFRLLKAEFLYWLKKYRGGQNQ